MQATVQAGVPAGQLPLSNPSGAGVHVQTQPDNTDVAHFQAMFQQHLNQQSLRMKPDTHSLGSALAQRTTSLASEVKKDQLYVSKMLEQASRTGDSTQLMKAMLALNDYQLRVQAISKTVSKASTSVDSLTKLQ